MICAAGSTLDGMCRSSHTQVGRLSRFCDDVKVWAVPTGRDAADLENSVVGWLEDQGAVFCERYDVC